VWWPWRHEPDDPAVADAHAQALRLLNTARAYTDRSTRAAQAARAARSQAGQLAAELEATLRRRPTT